MDKHSCSHLAIADLVSALEVMLLDSKCYPIFHNTATTEVDFWKSTRKVLAASKARYEEPTGKPFSFMDAKHKESEVALGRWMLGLLLSAKWRRVQCLPLFKKLYLYFRKQDGSRIQY